MPFIFILFTVFTLFEDIKKEDFLTEVNKIRKEGCTCGDTYFPPAEAVTWNNDLQKASELHSKDMKNKNYFSHVSKDGKTPADRAKAQKYNYRNLAENIFVAQGYNPTVQEVVSAWKNSPPHCKNLMNKDVKEMGVGTYKGYYTQLFGTR